MKKSSPTIPGSVRGSKRAGRKRSVSTAAARRVSIQPEIYVKATPNGWYRHKYARARLRNKGGYLYLAWRDGEKIRTFYLGKARRNYPTLEGRPVQDQASPAPARSSSSRRGKNGVRR